MCNSGLKGCRSHPGKAGFRLSINTSQDTREKLGKWPRRTILFQFYVHGYVCVTFAVRRDLGARVHCWGVLIVVGLLNSTTQIQNLNQSRLGHSCFHFMFLSFDWLQFLFLVWFQVLSQLEFSQAWQAVFTFRFWTDWEKNAKINRCSFPFTVFFVSPRSFVFVMMRQWKSDWNKICH